jgi:predicted dehydrogenase
MYCEKPLANSVGEGQAMVDWVKKTGTVLQMGTHWRMSTHFGDAVNYVQSGKLGKIRLVRCWCALAWFKPVGHVEDSDTPAGVDYDMWLGPAPARRFNRGRFHFSFRWYWDYAGGLMTDWGVHLLNIAIWAMKVGAPKRVAAVGGKWLYNDDAETPDTQNTLYDYGDFGLVWEHQACTGHGAEGREHGVAFYGEKGTLIVDADGWEVAPEGAKAQKEVHKRTEDGELCRQRLMSNFLECCRTRNKPAEDAELGNFVTTTAHLGNLALRTGRSIEYDAANMKVIGNDEANAMITRPYRKPWELPKA